MCIIILNTKEHLSKEVLNECWISNNDGAGLMYSHNGKLNIIKELKNFDKYYEKYSSIRTQLKDVKIGLHFRIGTSGKIDTNNIHPFNVNENLAFMHNGIIDIPLVRKSKVSDTIAFNQKILKQLPNNFIDNIAVHDLISKYIDHSKLLFMNNTGKYWILNENLGHWDKNGNWYSNYSYCELSSEFELRSQFWSNDPNEYNVCQYCDIELLEDREMMNETCYMCMERFSETENIAI